MMYVVNAQHLLCSLSPRPKITAASLSSATPSSGTGCEATNAAVGGNQSSAVIVDIEASSRDKKEEVLGLAGRVDEVDEQAKLMS